MAYTKDYYHILSLEAPAWGAAAAAAARQNNTTVDLRRAYKIALLAAHPDKKAKAEKEERQGVATGGYTVDDVKEAYTVLANSKTRIEYENWFLRNGDTLRSRSSSLGGLDGGRGREEGPSSDFILGLELLDLSDFEAEEEADNGVQDDDARMQWTRECRCGADQGFRILEEELEDAERRGEKEVLVGCEGCSLWVRVGFDVEEG